MKKLVIATALVIATSASARENVSISGSSTVLPFATIVAERFGRNPEFNTPVVEAGGSSVGKKSVCDGIGAQYTDIGNASSRMKEGELEYCTNNGITLTEIKVGYDGIVIANSKDAPHMSITKSDLGKALTAQVAYEGKLIDNPYMKWSDINPAYPDIAIRVYGPPTTSGTRASYAEIVNEKGYCKTDPEMIAVLKEAGVSAKNCRSMRTDGAYIEAGEQDNLIVQKLQDDVDSFGIFGFSYLDQNSDSIQGTLIDGVEPSFEAIADGSYKASRAMYFYVKHEHIGVIPGLLDYVKAWTKYWNEDGILADAGMIPLPEAEMAFMTEVINTMPVLTKEDLN